MADRITFNATFAVVVVVVVVVVVFQTDRTAHFRHRFSLKPNSAKSISLL